MSNGRRPGGLTALAIINIIWASLTALGLIFLAIGLAVMQTGLLDEAFDEEVDEAGTTVEAPAEPGESEEGAEEPPADDAEEPSADGAEEAPPERRRRSNEMSERDREQLRLMKEMMTGEGKWLTLVRVVLGILIVVLQIVAAVGMLKQKRRLGRTVANWYAILALASVVFALTTLPAGMVNHWMLLIDLIVPVVTLVLVNTTFKDDLIY